MLICGLQKLSMVDYPGKLAATIFTGGCNLRCPFCHNAPLVIGTAQAPVLEESEVLDFLNRRKGLLDGVVLTGGEPLLHPDAADFLKKLRKLGFSVKLDTNGCYPEQLRRILEEHLVDYVAMDLKNSPDKYTQTVGLKNFDLAPVEESIRLLKTGCIDYEFRTTVVRELHTTQDILALAKWAQGAPRYFLQHFADSGNLISRGLHEVPPPEMDAMAQAAKPFFGKVLLRGV